MKRTNNILILLTSLALITGCQKDQEEGLDRSYSIIATELKEISKEGALLGGSFITPGTTLVQEFGFMLGDSKNSINHKILLENPEEEFSYMLNRDILEGKEFFFRAYAINKSHISLGNIVRFTSLGFIPSVPRVDSVSPRDLTDGGILTLVGNNFSMLKENIQVTAGTDTLELLETGPKKIVCRIPTLNAGKKVLHLKVFEHHLNTGEITIHAPQIQNMSPKEGYDRTRVTFQGNYFGEGAVVYFGGAEASIINQTLTTLEVESPVTMAAGPVEVSIHVGEKVTTSPESFSTLTLQVSGISASEGQIGDIIHIQGKGFIQNDRISKVFFSNLEAKIYHTSNDIIDVIVPNGISSLHTITVKNGLKEVEAGKFQVHKSWTQLGNFPGSAMDHLVSETVNGFGYLGMGKPSTTEWWRFDPTDQSWLRMADFPGAPRYSSRSFVINDKIYIVFGSDGNIAYNELWEYNPASDIWVRKTNPPGPGELFVPWYSSGGSFQGKGYIHNRDNIMLYDPMTDQWETRMFPFETDPTTNPFSFTLNNRFYWFFGSDYCLLLYEYLPDTDQWVSLKKICDFQARTDYTIFTLNNRGYFGGGRHHGNSGPNQDAFFEFNPNDLTLVEKESFHTFCTRQAAFNIGGKAYVGLGLYYNSELYKEFWSFDP